MDYITPSEYIRRRSEIQAQIDILEAQINELAEQAYNAPMPSNVRRATAEDIVPGAIIWRINTDFGDRWHEVAQVLYPDDDFKAYVADDGSRYGLYNAYVEIENE